MIILKGNIFNIQKFCLHDGPGIRTTVFFKGCNLRCAWCANPESQLADIQLTLDAGKCTGCGGCAAACPAGARSVQDGISVLDAGKCVLCGACEAACPAQAIGREGRLASVDEIVGEVMKDAAFYARSGGGVTFSGGEPLMQPDFIIELAQALRDRGVSVALETAANVEDECFRRLLPKLDFIFVDLKHYDDTAHRAGTGTGNARIIENIRSVRESGISYMVRIPVIPGYNDALQDAAGFAALLAELDVKQVQLLPFHQLGEKKYILLGKEYAFEGARQLHPEDLEQYRQEFEKYGVHAHF